MSNTLSPGQIRAARAFLNWSMLDFARMARVSIATIRRVEQSGLAVAPTAEQEQIATALATAGVQFLSDDGTGEGVRLKAF